MKEFWEETPFSTAAGALLHSRKNTNLPFSVGGITRHGLDHAYFGISNQDALNLIIEDDFIIGVLCDGCTNNHEGLVEQYSSNQAGAILLSQMIANLLYHNIRPRKNRMNIQKCLTWMSYEVHHRLRRIAKTFRVPENDRLTFACQNLLATSIAFVIRKQEYFIFHCGDGYVRVNTDEFDLSNDSGHYFTGVKGEEEKFKLVSVGNTKDLQSLCLASDGFQEGDILCQKSLGELCEETTKESGLINLLPEFHTKVLHDYYLTSEDMKQWPSDDSSMILLRRKTL